VRCGVDRYRLSNFRRFHAGWLAGWLAAQIKSWPNFSGITRSNSPFPTCFDLGWVIRSVFVAFFHTHAGEKIQLSVYIDVIFASRAYDGCVWFCNKYRCAD